MQGRSVAAGTDMTDCSSNCLRVRSSLEANFTGPQKSAAGERSVRNEFSTFFSHVKRKPHFLTIEASAVYGNRSVSYDYT